jgi:hypothetical protein
MVIDLDNPPPSDTEALRAMIARLKMMELVQDPEEVQPMAYQQPSPMGGETGWERIAPYVGQQDYDHPYYEQAMRWQEAQARRSLGDTRQEAYRSMLQQLAPWR